MALDTSSLAYMIEKAGGLLVRYAGTTAYGLLDYPDEELFGDEASIVAANRFLTMKTGAIAAGKGDTVTVDGTDYVVRKAMKVDDGLLTVYWLGDS